MSLDLAWAAGFFDGEGSVYVRHTKRHKGGTGKYYPLTTVEASIAQVRPEPLHRFIDAVEVGSICGPYQPKNLKHSAYCRWDTAGRPSTHKIATLLWPYLSAPKREQFHKCWGELKALRTNKSPKLMELPECSTERGGMASILTGPSHTTQHGETYCH